MFELVRVFYKEKIEGAVKAGGCTGRDMVDFWILREENKDKQGHSPGLQNRLWPDQKSTLKNPMSCSPRQKRSQGELIDFQGSPPLSSEMIIPMYRR